MSDEKQTVQLPSIKVNALEPVDDTLTDEFQIDLDVDEHEATRRLDSAQLPTIAAEEPASVPGRNSTMPLPAVSASKTAATKVPDELLVAMRSELGGDTVERTSPIELIEASRTEEMMPAIEFVATIDSSGRLQIPQKYEGLVRTGQSVHVRIQKISKADS